MTVVAITSSKRVIASKTRAMEIVERMALKHDLPVATALCAKRDRYARACRAEIAWALKRELNWSSRRSAALLGVTFKNVCVLLKTHEIAMRRAKNVLPVTDLQALAAIEADELRRRLVESQDLIAHLQGELDRLTGATLANKIAARFGLENRLRCAIVLAILVEAYPRSVPSNLLTELYDEACDRLNYGSRNGASADLIKKNFSSLREHFAELGLACPVDWDDAGARRLTDAGAELLHEAVSAPRLSQLKPDARSRFIRLAVSR